MKILKDTPLPNGKTRMIIELDSGETILPLRANAHYRLGQPVDDVMGAHILHEAQEVTWCSVEQKWTDS